VLSELGRDIRAFEAMVEALPIYDEWHEAQNVLVWRESIQADMDEGACPTANERRILARSDAALAALRDLIVQRFPEAFDCNVDIPTAYWWWHLDKGPQARPPAITPALVS
jgi:hypothetical protein